MTIQTIQTIDTMTGQEILDAVLPPTNRDGLQRVAHDLRALHNAESGTERKLLYVAFTIVDFLIYVKIGDKSASAEAKKAKYIRLALATFERHHGKLSGNDI